MTNSCASEQRRGPRLLWDVSGAFGDIGVLLPLAIALVGANGLNASAVFLAAGLFYILSARYFGITMPVQPLKAMAAIAIAAGLGPGILRAAGFSMGVLLLFLAVTGWSDRLGRLIPLSVIRGLQLGLGLLLARTGMQMIPPADLPLAVISAAVLALCFFVLRGLPPMIPLLALGIGFGLRAAPAVSAVSFGGADLSPGLPSAADLPDALVLLVLPQIALTFGNAVVATASTARTLYGDQAASVNLRSLPTSMGIANLVSAVLGGAPMCHGSGGVTAHRALGARDARSGYIVGAVLVLLALLFGGSATAILSAFPKAILGVLLLGVGAQHAGLIRDCLRDRRAAPIALASGAAGLVTNNLTIGFLTGLALHSGLAGSFSAYRRFATRKVR